MPRTRVYEGVSLSLKRHVAVLVPVIFAFLAFGSVPAGAAQPPARAGQTTSKASSSATAAKKKPVKKRRKSSRMSSQKAPTRDRITDIQSALARNGYYQDNPNGKWDANTIAAMKKFQAANGLSADGKLDALSLQKLGLGSAIAGVSAPKPVTPPGSASLAPSSTAPSSGAPSSSAAPGQVRQSLGVGGSVSNLPGSTVTASNAASQ